MSPLLFSLFVTVLFAHYTTAQYPPPAIATNVPTRTPTTTTGSPTPPPQPLGAKFLPPLSQSTTERVYIASTASGIGCSCDQPKYECGGCTFRLGSMDAGY